MDTNQGVLAISERGVRERRSNLEVSVAKVVRRYFAVLPSGRRLTVVQLEEEPESQRNSVLVAN